MSVHSFGDGVEEYYESESVKDQLRRTDDDIKKPKRKQRRTILDKYASVYQGWSVKMHLSLKDRPDLQSSLLEIFKHTYPGWKLPSDSAFMPAWSEADVPTKARMLVIMVHFLGLSFANNVLLVEMKPQKSQKQIADDEMLAPAYSPLIVFRDRLQKAIEDFGWKRISEAELYAVCKTEIENLLPTWGATLLAFPVVSDRIRGIAFI
jgi:hypothetical protein